jgi:lysophospholipase L1-like esterase
VRLLRCLTVLAAALPLALLPAASGQAAPPSPAVYLALGDSVAFGTGATDPATQGYVPLLAADLQGDGCGGKGKGKAVGCRVELVNLAENGATTVTLIAKQLQPALDLIEARNATRTSVDDVRLITITIGGNDVVDPVVQACLLGGAVVPGLPVVAAGFNDAIRQQAAAYGAVIVETAAVVDPQTETQPDCLHPNTKGHADIAAAVADAVGNPFHGRGGKKR